MQKGQTLILLLTGVLILAGIVGGAFYLGRRTTPKQSPTPVIISQTPQPTPSPLVPDETANWKTYTNTQYGYSISYPNNWEVKNMGSIDPKTLELVALNPSQVENEFSAVNIIVSGRNYEQELELLGPNSLPAKVNYVNATRANHKNPDGKEYIVVLFNLNNGQNSLRIEAESEHQNIFEKMLSTFKFLNQKVPDCKVTGCSGKVCSEKEVITTCEWQEAYACYRNAKCERQTDGQCGWTKTAELTRCLDQVQQFPQ